MTPEPRDATTDQLRHAIDSGATGDKVDFADPAAAPLGTDEEAAGTPVPPEAAAQALRYESRRAPVGRPGALRAGLLAAAAGVVAIAAIAAVLVYSA